MDYVVIGDSAALIGCNKETNIEKCWISHCALQGGQRSQSRVFFASCLCNSRINTRFTGIPDKLFPRKRMKAKAAAKIYVHGGGQTITWFNPDKVSKPTKFIQPGCKCWTSWTAANSFARCWCFRSHSHHAASLCAATWIQMQSAGSRRHNLWRDRSPTVPSAARPSSSITHTDH